MQGTICFLCCFYFSHESREEKTGFYVNPGLRSTLQSSLFFFFFWYVFEYWVYKRTACFVLCNWVAAFWKLTHQIVLGYCRLSGCYVTFDATKVTHFCKGAFLRITPRQVYLWAAEWMHRFCRVHLRDPNSLVGEVNWKLTLESGNWGRTFHPHIVCEASWAMEKSF